MNVFMYKAALLCEGCGHAVIEDCKVLRPETVPADTEDESSFDSDDFPKGPYANGGGEADTPQHCDHCDLFLENPLTDDGRVYVGEAALEFETEGANESWEEIAVKADAQQSPTLAQWIRFYFADGQ